MENNGQEIEKAPERDTEEAMSIRLSEEDTAMQEFLLSLEEGFFEHKAIHDSGRTCGASIQHHLRSYACGYY